MGHLENNKESSPLKKLLMEDFVWFIQITVFCVYLLLFNFALGLFNLGPFKLGDLIHHKVNFGIKISEILIYYSFNSWVS